MRRKFVNVIYKSFELLVEFGSLVPGEGSEATLLAEGAEATGAAVTRPLLGGARVMVEAVEAVVLWRGEEAVEDDDLRAHCDSSSMGNGNMMVEFFSALMELRVWR